MSNPPLSGASQRIGILLRGPLANKRKRTQPPSRASSNSSLESRGPDTSQALLFAFELGCDQLQQCV